MKRICLIAILFFVFVLHQKAEAQENKRLIVNSILQSNMVVQQNKPFKVWGYAPAGETVSIIADWIKAPVRVTAATENKFLGIVPVPVVKKGDFTKHKITVTLGNELVVLDNVLIGETWICSGQSNMQFAMKETIDSAVEIPAANYPNIRLFSAGLNFNV